VQFILIDVFLLYSCLYKKLYEKLIYEGESGSTLGGLLNRISFGDSVTLVEDIDQKVIPKAGDVVR